MKWAAARRCARLLLRDRTGRDLLREFCEACITTPPVVENFEIRSLYFSLRKDIGDFLPGATQATHIETLASRLGDRRFSPARLLSDITDMAWTATLLSGLASLYLRRGGQVIPDQTADALQAWQPQWRRREKATQSDGNARRALRNTLRHYVAARDTFILHNLRLVHKIAREYRSRGITHADLVQEGIVGLMRAAEKYDYRRGYRFTTYAYPWITQHLQRATENGGSLITYPAHVVQDINTLHAARTRYRETSGAEASIEELAERTGFEPERVRKLRALTNITLSINQDDEQDTPINPALDLVHPDSARAQLNAQQKSIQKLLMQQLDQLDAREREILKGRWGLDGQPLRTLSQLSEELGVSREWVRQLEKSALEKLSQREVLREAHDTALA